MNDKTAADTTPRMDPISALVKGSWVYYFHHIKGLIGISLFFVIPEFVINLLFQIYLYTVALNGVGRIDFWDKHFSLLLPTYITFWVFVVALVFWGVWYSIANIIYISNIGQNIRPRHAFQMAKSYYWQFFRSNLLLSLIIVGGAALLLVPGIFWATAFCLVPIVIVVENRKTGIFQRSKQLTAGHQRAIFVRFLVLELSIFLALFLVTLSSNLLVRGLAQLDENLGLLYDPLSQALGTLLFPVFTIATFKIFQNIKHLKESKESLPAPVR